MKSLIIKEVRLSIIASVAVVLIGLFPISTAIAEATLVTLPNQASETLKSSLYTAIGPVLKQSDGQITPEVREAYLEWATNEVFTTLAGANRPIPADILAEVWSDPTLRDAMYRSVFPPDPSILQNYAHWRGKLAPEFIAKYQSLVMAFCVGKRVSGVELVSDMDAIPAGTIARDNRDAQGNYEPGFWVDESLRPVQSEGAKLFVSSIAEFMKTNDLAALEIYKTPRLQSELITYLKDHKVEPAFVSSVKQSEDFGEYLKNAMVLLGQRPGSRQPKPDTATWLRYLTSTYEAKPLSIPIVDNQTITWPLFPIGRAPWPLLMPLTRPVPVDEARYIWETYQGRHGSDRFHTYGPFRGGADAMPYELQPSPWYWDAWPDRILHGGECISISKGTLDLYSSLGKPAVWAGQPGHANLISFKFENARWAADVEQAFAGGPEVTYAQWYFEDDPATALRFRDLYHWPGAEYNLGLALGMNRSLQSYIDTRMAANIFKVLPLLEQQTVGAKMLRHALAANPYNPDLWYRLALLTSDPIQGMTFVQELLRQPKDQSGYWKTVSGCAAHFCIMDRPPPQNEGDLRKICFFLGSVPGVNFKEVEVYSAKFYLALAARNDAYGQFRMGQRYLDGIGISKNEQTARDYFTKSANQGNKDAQQAMQILNCTVPADEITVTASSQYGSDQDVRHLIDGAGMRFWMHDNNGSARTMWHSVSKPVAHPPNSGLPPSPAWVKFDFAKPVHLASVRIWNHNQSGLTDRGFRKTAIYGSTDGGDWFQLTTPMTVEIPQATGNIGQTPITVNLNAIKYPVKSVIVAAALVDGNYGSDCYGLSAIRFLVNSNSIAVDFNGQK